MSDAAIPIAILDGIEAPVLLFQEDGALLTMNRAAADRLGRRAEAGTYTNLQ